MKLAEALIERAALQTRIEGLRSRIVLNARFQEGEEPTEDAAALLLEAESAIEDLRALVLAINVSNAQAQVEGGGTLTAALAERDALRKRHAFVTSAADAAAGRTTERWERQLRSELKQLPALPVADLRRRGDELAATLRGLEARIQRANWEVDLQQ